MWKFLSQVELTVLVFCCSVSHKFGDKADFAASQFPISDVGDVSVISHLKANINHYQTCRKLLAINNYICVRMCIHLNSNATT